MTIFKTISIEKRNVTRLPAQSDRKRIMPSRGEKKGTGRNARTWNRCDVIDDRRWRRTCSLKVTEPIRDRIAYFYHDVFTPRPPTEAATSETGTGLTRFTSARFTLAARNKYGKSITRLAKRRRWGTMEGEEVTAHAAERDWSECTTQSRGAAHGAKEKKKKEEKKSKKDGVVPRSRAIA